MSPFKFEIDVPNPHLVVPDHEDDDYQYTFHFRCADGQQALRDVVRLRDDVDADLRASLTGDSCGGDSYFEWRERYPQGYADSEHDLGVAAHVYLVAETRGAAKRIATVMARLLNLPKQTDPETWQAGWCCLTSGPDWSVLITGWCW